MQHLIDQMETKMHHTHLTSSNFTWPQFNLFFTDQNTIRAAMAAYQLKFMNTVTK